MPMKPASLSGDRMPGGHLLAVLRPFRRRGEIGRSGEQLAPRRVGAGIGGRFAFLLDRGLELLHGEQRRRHHRSGGPAAARSRPFRQIGIADPDLDLVRLQAELVRHRVGDHGAAAGADILDRGARDDASALDREFDLRAGLPEIEPVSGGDADAAAIAAGLRSLRSCCARPRARRPNRTAAGGWDWDPSACAARSDRGSSAAPPRRSPVPARTPSAARRDRGTARRAAGC